MSTTGPIRPDVEVPDLGFTILTILSTTSSITGMNTTCGHDAPGARAQLRPQPTSALRLQRDRPSVLSGTGSLLHCHQVVVMVIHGSCTVSSSISISINSMPMQEVVCCHMIATSSPPQGPQPRRRDPPWGALRCRPWVCVQGQPLRPLPQVFKSTDLKTFVSIGNKINLRKTSTPIPCYECATVQYCCETCRDLAWEQYHRFDKKKMWGLLNK